MKSRKRFLHLSSFSDSNSFMTAGPGLLWQLLSVHTCNNNNNNNNKKKNLEFFVKQEVSVTGTET